MLLSWTYLGSDPSTRSKVTSMMIVRNEQGSSALGSLLIVVFWSWYRVVDCFFDIIPSTYALRTLFMCDVMLAGPLVGLVTGPLDLMCPS